MVKVCWFVQKFVKTCILTGRLQGVPTIRRAIINIKEDNDHRGKKGDKELLVEGYGLQKVMTTQGATEVKISRRILC